MPPRMLASWRPRPTAGVPVLDFLLPWATPSLAGPSGVRRRYASDSASSEMEPEAGPSQPPEARLQRAECAPASKETSVTFYGMSSSSNGLTATSAPVSTTQSSLVVESSTKYRRPWRRKSLLPHLQPPSRDKLPRLTGPEFEASTPLPSQSRHLRDPILSSLSRLDPPSPSHLLDHLRADLSGLSKPRGELVARYAARLSNKRIERATQDLMGRMRLGPLEWVKRPRRPRRRKALESAPSFLESENTNQPRITSSEHASDEVLDSSLPVPRSPKIPLKIASSRSFTRDIPGHMLPSFNPPLSSITSRYITSLLPLRPQIFEPQPPNPWATKRWPVTDVKNRKIGFANMDDFVSHLHNSLVTGGYGVPDINQALAIVERISSEPQVKLRYQHDILHLYLAYTPTPRDTSATLSTLLQIIESATFHRPNLLPTRQTLHLLVLRLLSTSTRRDGSAALLQGMLESFSDRWYVEPGCETLRHLALFAIRIRDRSLAEQVWEKWWREYARMSSLADLEAMEALSGGTPLSFTSNAAGPTTPGDVQFRFRRRGRQLARWWKVVNQFEKRGWIDRVILEGQEDEPARYRWIDVVTQQSISTA